MAGSQTTSYVIAVSDSVDPSIERKLIGISTAATDAGASCSSLQASLSQLNASGIASAAQAMGSATTASRSLSTSTQTFTRSANSATTAANNFANAIPRLESTCVAAAAAINAAAASLNSFSTAARGANTAAAAPAIPGLGPAANTATQGVRGMSAALTVARGNITGANRLAAQFLSTLVGSGPIIQAAFSVLGFVALVAVLAQVASAIYNVIQAYKNMSLASAQAALQAIDDGDKIVKVRASIFTAENAARLIEGRGIDRSDLIVTQVDALQKQQQATDQLAQAQRNLNEAGLSGAALQKQKAADDATDITRLQQQRTAMQGVADQVKAQRLAQSTVHHVQTSDSGNDVEYDTTSNTVTDSDQIKELQKQYKAATDAVKEFNTQIDVKGLDIQADARREAIAAIKDEAKAAALEMRQLNAAFKDYEASLTHKITPQEGLDFWETAEAGLRHYSSNIDAVNAKEGVYNQQIAARNDSLQRINEGLDDQVASIGSYSDALKVQQEVNKATLEFQRQRQPLDEQETATLRNKYTVIQAGVQYQQELNAEYTAANGPQRTYTAQQEALNDLLEDGSIGQAKYAQLLAVANQTFADSQNPMASFERGLKAEVDLFGTYGDSLTVLQQLQQQQESLRERGITQTQQQTSAMLAELTVLNQQKQVQADINTLYGQNQGALDKLTISQTANSKAYAEGVITAGQYRNATIQNIAAQNQLASDRGMATFGQSMQTIFAGLTKNYTTFASGATKSFSQFFTTLSDGFADSIGHLVAFGGSVKSALLDVARQAVSGLVSSLIKLGLQWIITQTLGAALAASALAANTATATATAEAWAPAAALASLATLGANGVAADTAIASTSLFTAALAATHLANGGEVYGPGSSTSDSVPAMLSAGEFVVKASAYQQNKSAVQAINNGSRPVFAQAANSTGSTSNGQGTRVEIHNYTGQDVQAQQISEGHIRIIAGQEAKAAVYKHSDDAVSQNLTNPSSKTSLANSRYTTSTRKRV